MSRSTCTRTSSGPRCGSALFAEGETAARAGGDQAVLARLQLLRGVFQRDVPLAMEAVRTAEAVLPVAEQATMLAQLAHLQFAVADFEGMTATAARLAELSELVPDPEVAFGPGRRVAIWRGDLAGAQRLTDEITRRTRSAGPHVWSHTLGLQAWLAEAAGDWPAVRRLVGEFLALAQANEGTSFCVSGGTAVLAAGSVAAAREGLFDEAWGLLRRAGTYIRDPEALHALSIASAVLGERAGVIPPEPNDRWGWEDFATACVILGDAERAAAVLPRLDRWAEQGSWLSGATADAIRDEIEGRGAAGPGHAKLRERGYNGPSDELGMRSPGR